MGTARYTGTSTGTGNMLMGANYALVCTHAQGHTYRDYSVPSYPDQFTEYTWAAGASSTITMPVHVVALLLAAHPTKFSRG